MAKTCMEYREQRRKYPNQVRNRFRLQLLLGVRQPGALRDVQLFVWPKVTECEVSQFVRQRRELGRARMVAVDVYAV